MAVKAKKPIKKNFLDRSVTVYSEGYVAISVNSKKNKHLWDTLFEAVEDLNSLVGRALDEVEYSNFDHELQLHLELSGGLRLVKLMYVDKANNFPPVLIKRMHLTKNINTRRKSLDTVLANYLSAALFINSNEQFMPSYNEVRKSVNITSVIADNTSDNHELYPIINTVCGVYYTSYELDKLLSI